MDDLEIIKIIRDDKNKAIEIIMKEYTGLLFHIVKNVVHKPSDVEDVVSEIFIEFYNNMEKINLNRGSIKALLGTMAYRRAIDWKRSNKDELELHDDFFIDEFDVLDLIIEKEEKEFLFKILDEVKEPDKTMLIGRYFFNIPSEKLAEKYNLKPNTVDKRISRAIELLRNIYRGVSI